RLHRSVPRPYHRPFPTRRSSDLEPTTGPAEAGHHLVGDHQDLVPIAQLADTLDVTVGRDEDAVRAHDRLEEDRRDRVRALVADDVLEAAQALLDRARLLLAPAMGVRVADDADEAGIVRPAAGIAGQGHRSERRPVIGPIPGENHVSTGVVAGGLCRVLRQLP